MNDVLLSVKDLFVSYGNIQAVKGIDLEIREGELVTLIGANGAGKTTTLKAITGTQAWAGAIDYCGTSTGGKAPHQLLRRGLVMVPEGRGVFTRMTVTENLQMGAFARDDTAAIAEDMEKMFATFPRLKERARQLAGTLSGGEQQMLAMARAMMSRPKLLLLDEPSMGLSPLMVEKIFEVVRSVAAAARSRDAGHSRHSSSAIATMPPCTVCGAPTKRTGKLPLPSMRLPTAWNSSRGDTGFMRPITGLNGITSWGSSMRVLKKSAVVWSSTDCEWGPGRTCPPSSSTAESMRSRTAASTSSGASLTRNASARRAQLALASSSAGAVMAGVRAVFMQCSQLLLSCGAL